MNRSCNNCVFWNRDSTNSKIGKCTFVKMFFAYTLAQNVHPYTKNFFLCKNHKLDDEPIDNTENNPNIEDMETYYNRNGFPILRRCDNCNFWRRKNTENMGMCMKHKYLLAFEANESPNLFATTKAFSLCDLHKFCNEDYLKRVSQKIKLKDAIKDKSDVV